MPTWLTRKGTRLTCTRRTFIRYQLPHGCWSTASGREILFDRSYSPICERRDGGPPQLADPTEWVRDIVKQDWFYNDGTAQTGREKAAMKALADWGMLEAVMADIEGRLARPVRSRARWRGQALLVTPLLNKGEVIGAIVLRQSHLKPFTERQMQAIEVFADQAVIAITDRLREPRRGSSAS